MKNVIAVVVLCFCPSMLFSQATKTITCIKTESYASLWADQNMQGADIETIKCGEPVTVLSEPSKNFAETVRVRTKDGKEGYIPGRFLGFASTINLVPNKKADKKLAKVDQKAAKICSEHSSWTESQCIEVAANRVVPGMTAAMVVASWGVADHVSTTQFQGGHSSETWDYASDAFPRCIVRPTSCGYTLNLDDRVVTAVTTGY